MGITNIRHPWGKRPRNDTETSDTHHLAHHCADVAAVLAALLNLPTIKSRLDTAAKTELSPVQIERVCALVFLHDAGKLHPGFQAKGWSKGIWRGRLTGHVREGLEIFLIGQDNAPRPAALALQIQALSTWGVSQSLLRSVISHHGRPAPTTLGNSDDVLYYWRTVAEYDPDAAAKVIGDVMPLWFPLAFSDGPEPLPTTPAFEHLLCGLTTLADWLGSDNRQFPFVPEFREDYYETAKHRANKAVRAIQIDCTVQRAALSQPVTFHTVANSDWMPNPQQQEIGETDLDATLVILESETGSGKTESALLRYAKLFEAGRVDGLYFAVPTRAAAVQLHERVLKAMRRIFKSDAPEAVLAIPGYLRAGKHKGRALPDWKTLWDDDPDAEQLAKRWAAENSKRYLAAQVAVGTVDQAMMGALKVKHAHLRSASLCRSLLVIDEVHASDSFMCEIQKRLLDVHLGVGGYAMLMSATLGSGARAAWLKCALPTCKEAIETPYPAIWNNKAEIPASTQESQRNKSVRMHLQQTMLPQLAAQKALEAAAAGARVLVIRNTVSTAIDTLRTIELERPGSAKLLFNIKGVPTLHHSRFAPSDRRILDQKVEAALSTDKTRMPCGLIVIGTQTLEQSLDIDADLLITDLCPVDVLLQRIGRLHRHQLARPDDFEVPQCIVMTPENGLAPLLKPAFENGLGAWEVGGALEGVYRDVPVLELTRRLVEDYEEWHIPEMNRLLVERATHRECIDALIDELGDDWKNYQSRILGREFADKGGAVGLTINYDESFEELQFPSGEERIRTRLGEDGIRIKLTKPEQGPFGEEFQELILPAHMSHGIDPEVTPRVDRTSDGGLLITCDEKEFVYDRFGLQKGSLRA